MTSDLDGSSPAPIVRRGRSVRGQLNLYTIALVGPILAFTAFLLWQIASSERTLLENEAPEIARSLARDIDRELTGLFAALDVLSLSRNLQERDLESFHKQATELFRRQGIVSVLSDLSGQQLVNVRQPWGAALPVSKFPVDAQALGRGRPVVTDLFVGAVAGAPLFAVVTTVVIDGAPAYTLGFRLAVDRLQQILRDAKIPSAYTATIVDRAGIILARSARPEEFVGKRFVEDIGSSTAGRQGASSGTTVDGAAVFGADARSRLPDFRAAVAIRYSDLNAPLWRSLSLFAALGALIAGLSALLGLLVGKRLTGPIQALAAQAVALGRGEPAPALSTGLAEANQVGTELAAASLMLREREAELRDATEEMQRFAYIVSHDLRSPLVNIMGFTTELEALRQDMFERLAQLRGDRPGTAAAGPDDELGRDFDEAIGFIKTSIAKMDRLINAILRLSREGRREFHPERIDMEALFGSIKAGLAHQAEAADATVTVSALPPVTSDRLALEQIFSNLVDNALKYLRGGAPGLVEISGRATPAGLVYDVRDNGRGIDVRDRERVFDLFRRSGVQDRPGEGIGLAHVRALVRRLGGTIALTSEPGQGSTFTVTLPRRWAGDSQRKAA